MTPNFKTLASERKYAGKVFNLVVDRIEYASGNAGVREIAEHPGGAVVVPVLDDGRIILIKQYRYPIKKFIYELPAGKLESNEDPRHCAERELAEETGYSASSFDHLTSIYTTPGFCTEQLHIFLAQGLMKLEVGQKLEEGEQGLSMEVVPLQQAVQMVVDKEIVDGKSIAGIFLAERQLRG
jgi:ADP-ribose pyrophosphatase